MAISANVPTTTAIIALSATDSQAIPLGNLTLTGIGVPTITSALITLRVSSDGGATFQGLINSSGEVSYAPAGGTGPSYIAVNPSDVLGVDYVVIRTGVNAGGVHQLSAVSLPLHLREKR